MLRRRRMRVMIVVPALAERQQGHPPAIGGEIACGKAARTPRVRGRIHQPRGVQADHGAHENSPHQEWHSADGQQNHAQNNHRDVVKFRNPDVEFVLGEVGNVAGQRGRVMVHGLAHENPAHVCPPFSIDRRMRIAIFIGKLMMDAVRGNPENWAALKRKRGANRQEILNPFRSLVAAVREQAMISHADAQAA